MTPLGRALEDVTVSEPNVAVTVYGRPLGSVTERFSVTVSPDQPPKFRPESGVAVSVTALPSVMNVPVVRLIAVSALIVRPPPPLGWRAGRHWFGRRFWFAPPPPPRGRDCFGVVPPRGGGGPAGRGPG